MKTLIIPIDFSAPSNNAVDYAAELSNDRQIKKIILVTNCHVSLFEQLLPSADFIQAFEEDIQSRKKQLIQQFEELRLQLLKKLHPDIAVMTIISELPLLRSVLDLIVKENPVLMVIGSNSNDTGEDSFIGRNLVELTKASPIPVLIIPPLSRYQSIIHAVVACDLKSLTPINLLQRIHKLKDWLHPQLSLLNVAPGNKHSESGLSAQEIEQVLSDLLKDFQYRLYYSGDPDILRGIIT